MAGSVAARSKRDEKPCPLSRSFRRKRPWRPHSQDHDEWIRVSKFAVRRTCILQKLNKQLAHLFRLLLLQPVTGSVYKVGAAHLRAGGILHGLERTRALENAPIALAADE